MAGAGAGFEGARYRALIDSVLASSGARVRERLLFPPECDEIELQSLWFSGAFGREFVTVDGRPVEIVQFGHWNHGAGPDFEDGAVLIDGKKHTGPIELDPDARDWEAHGHSTNPAYDGVVLHVFMSGPEGGAPERFTRTSDHREIPQLRLEVTAALEDWPGPRLEADAHLGRCATPLREMPADRIDALLREAAHHRLSAKAARLRRRAEIHGRSEAIYQGVAEALGYRPNQLAMTVLAQRLPLARLRKLPDPERAALLLGSGGYLDKGGFDAAPADTREYLQGLWDGWWKVRDVSATAPHRRVAWKTTGIRPGNHPQRRLAALSVIAGRWDRLARCLRDGASFSERQVRGFFQKLDHPFWSWHYTLNSAAAKKPQALVGASRVTEILANLVYPLLIDECDAEREARSALWDAYAKLPAELSSKSLDRAVARLFGDHPERDSFTRKIYQQQGLLQIYRDFCLEDDSGCEDCPFPEQLRQWR